MEDQEWEGVRQSTEDGNWWVQHGYQSPIGWVRWVTAIQHIGLQGFGQWFKVQSPLLSHTAVTDINTQKHLVWLTGSPMLTAVSGLLKDEGKYNALFAHNKDTDLPIGGTDVPWGTTKLCQPHRYRFGRRWPFGWDAERCPLLIMGQKEVSLVS